MSNLFEDYREISNVRDKLDMLVELVSSAPRRVFLTKTGEVKAVVMSADDYKDLWNLEFERAMKIGDEEEELGHVFPNAEVMREMRQYVSEFRARSK